MARHVARNLVGVLVVLAMLGGLAPVSVVAQAQEDVVWPQLTVVQRHGGFDRPVNVAFVDDGTGRIFVGEHPGRIKVVKNGQVLPAPFLDISAQVSCCWEIGMIGMAFPGAFAQKQYFYVYYTDALNNSVIARFWVSRDNPDRADPDSEQILLYVRQYTRVHKGGQLAFGPDGNLTIALGDGRFADPPNVNMNAQNLANLYGKILRISTETNVVRPEQPTRRLPPATAATRQVFMPMVAMNGVPRYGIPSDNPFAGDPAKRGEIWLYGLRNPYRFAFDRQTGDLFIGDVGHRQWEEIDFKPAGSSGGQNYGWPILEGAQCFATPTCNPQGTIAPIAVYGHNDQQCAIVGGSVYRGAGNPNMQGVYFFADFCGSRVWGLKQVDGVWEMSPVLLDLDDSNSITSFAEDLEGALYLVDWEGGRLYQVREGGA